MPPREFEDFQKSADLKDFLDSLELDKREERLRRALSTLRSPEGRERIAKTVADKRQAIEKSLAPIRERLRTETGRNELIQQLERMPANPWQGMLPEVHRGAGPLYKNPDELRAMIQPGDIILSGKKGWEGAKGQVSLATGTPRGYHVAVANKPAAVETIESHPVYGVSRVDNPLAPKAPGQPDQHFQVLRMKNMTPAQRRGFLDRVRQHDTVSTGFEQELLGRLKAERRAGMQNPRTPDPLQRHLSEIVPGELNEYAALGRAAGYRGGLRAGMQELFGNHAASQEAAMARQQKNYKAFSKAYNSGWADMTEPALAGLRNHIATRPDGAGVTAKTFRKGTPVCVGNVCSTVAARGLPNNMQLVPNKANHEVLPNDWLRSNQVESVGRYVAPTTFKEKVTDAALSAAPTAIRGATAVGRPVALAGLKGVNAFSRLRRAIGR